MQGEETVGVRVGGRCRDAVLMLPSQDHKRDKREGDVGPNTGGMGAYAPVSLSSDALLLRKSRTRLSRRHWPRSPKTDSEFRGVLYAGIMLTDSGPRASWSSTAASEIPKLRWSFRCWRRRCLDPMLGGGAGRAARRRHPGVE